MMGLIGNIIVEYRNKNKMSRKELSENICTEKYIYLIEKGERNPSASIIKLLGDRLGVDLFSYYEYLDCKNPLLVKEHIEKFEMYRAKLEPQLLDKVTNSAIELEDFRNEPWIFEIEINKISYDIFEKNKYRESIEKVNSFINKLGHKYSRGIYLANAYLLLSICHIFLGDPISAKKASYSAYDAMENKYQIKRYEKTITHIKVNIMILSYLLGEYDNVIREAKEILNHKYKTDSFDRNHYAYFYLAFANYRKGMGDEVIEYFKKGIYLCLADHRAEDIKYIAREDAYKELINDERISRELAAEFKKKYNLGDEISHID